MIATEPIINIPEIETHKRVIDQPQPENAFVVWAAKTGKRHLIGPFSDFLQRKISSQEITNDGALQNDATKIFNNLSENQALISTIRDQLCQLGLDDHLIVSGEHGHLIKSILQANKFGSPAAHIFTVKPNEAVDLPKNRVHIHLEPDAVSLDIPTGMTQLSTTLLTQNIESLIQNSQLNEHSNTYTKTEEKKILAWAADQAIIRALLPREPILSQKSIKIGRLKKIISLAGSGSSSETFQASNPSWICEDPETGRKYVAKKCPDQTLQADAFGLKVLEFHGVPTYEYYLTVDPDDGRHVLVSGFLEGYQDPADVILFDKSVPAMRKKTILPPGLVESRAMQRGLLSEILIAEYNSKAHNMMVRTDDVEDFVHFDQGGALTSTASGKFKPFNPDLNVQDVEDVIHCFADWDPNAQEQVNAAYGQIVEVKNGELIIKDSAFARELLNQEQNIPIEWYYQALESADFTNGPESIQRLSQWILDIDQKLIPKYLEMPDSKRKEQYLRWAMGAKKNFQTAIQIGGELNFYKYALQKRRERLLSMWSNAISVAEKRPRPISPNTKIESDQNWDTVSSLDRTQINSKWWSAWNTVIDHNQNRSNVAAAATLLVESITNPPLLEPLNNEALLRPLDKATPRLSPERKHELVNRLVRGLKVLEVPLSSKGAIPTLESLTHLGKTSVWTTGDVSESAGHDFPGSLFDPGPLQSSREQLHKLHNAGIFDLRRKIGREKLSIEAHNDKLAELPRLAETALNAGQTELIIIDDGVENLAATTEILKNYPRLNVHLVLVNQGRKRTLSPLIIVPSLPNHHYHVVDQFDQIPQLVEGLGGDKEHRSILCDFDGVVTDNTAYRTQQEAFVQHVLLEEFRKPPEKLWTSIQDLTKEDFGANNVIPQIEAARKLGYKIVLTNGVYDILHPGHIDGLDLAKKEGGKRSFLVVGVNSDNSAREQGKSGPPRPIIGEIDRAKSVIGLDAPNAVIIFDEKTSDNLLNLVKPDIYVKGGDYSIEENHPPISPAGKPISLLPERDTIKEIGAKFISHPISTKLTTSVIINRILSNQPL